MDLLKREIERAARTRDPTSVLMLDLDKFKNINDTYGHLSGDVVLKEVADRICQVLRSYDSVGRYGGEEFVIILPECDQDQALQTAKRVKTAIAEKPVMAGGVEIVVTASIGVTTATPGNASGNELLATADVALYAAKAAGRDCAVVR